MSLLVFFLSLIIILSVLISVENPVGVGKARMVARCSK
jgi:hypothetical protein